MKFEPGNLKIMIPLFIGAMLGTTVSVGIVKADKEADVMAGLAAIMPKPAPVDSVAIQDSIARADSIAKAATADSIAKAVAATRQAKADSLAADSASASHPSGQPATPAMEPMESERLAKLFGSMQPKNAARVLEQMDDHEIQVILGYLRDREAAAILSNLSPERAAVVSRTVIRGERSAT